MVSLLLNDNSIKYRKLTKSKKCVFEKSKSCSKKCFYASFEILITWIDRSRCVDSIGDINFIGIYWETSQIKVQVIKNSKNQFSTKTVFVPKLIEITCSWAHILHAHMFSTPNLWICYQKNMKILRNIEFINFSVDQKIDWSTNRWYQKINVRCSS